MRIRNDAVTVYRSFDHKRGKRERIYVFYIILTGKPGRESERGRKSGDLPVCGILRSAVHGSFFWQSLSYYVYATEMIEPHSLNAVFLI